MSEVSYNADDYCGIPYAIPLKTGPQFIYGLHQKESFYHSIMASYTRRPFLVYYRDGGICICLTFIKAIFLNKASIALRKGKEGRPLGSHSCVLIFPYISFVMVRLRNNNCITKIEKNFPCVFEMFTVHIYSTFKNYSTYSRPEVGDFILQKNITNLCTYSMHSYTLYT